MIKIENLSISFGGVQAVKNVNLTINDGEIVGIVGESGSGKSVTALSVMGLLSANAVIDSGRILFDDVVLTEAGRKKDDNLYRKYQGDKMSMVFQEPMTSLNPTQKIGAQVEEILKLHTKMTKKDRREKVLRMLEAVGLNDADKLYDKYPHELSGGMRQRVMIAIATILEPDLLIADEPTTALDVSIQSQIVSLLKDINEKQHNSVIFITHDLNLARKLADRIVVMKDGEIVEEGAVEEIFNNPKKDYTKKLIGAILRGEKKYPSHIFNDSENLPKKILEVKDLSVFYENTTGIFGKKEKKEIVKHATFDLFAGETLGLVGESGCGKTTLSKALLGINPLISGEIKHFTNMPQIIFQDPYSSLNPSKTIGWLLEEPLRALNNMRKSAGISNVLGYESDSSVIEMPMTKDDIKSAALDMLKLIELDERYYYRHPMELSGGQRQRVSIGQALITRPGFIIADEPVSALDVTIQSQIMDLMKKIQEEIKVSYLFISHDMNVIYQMSDRVMVMKAGQIIELAKTDDIFANPREEYTKKLLEFIN